MLTVQGRHGGGYGSSFDAIPEPQLVRADLGRLLREVTVVRSLLRLAERKAEALRLTPTASCRGDGI